MNAPSDWFLYGGALVLVVIALRMAGGYSRSGRSASLHARTRKKQRLKRKSVAARRESRQSD